MTKVLYGNKHLIDLRYPEKMSIDFATIAHSLTKICRYVGSMPFDEHYSVANHTITLLDYAQKAGHTANVLRGILLHDASEAYLQDIPGPIKELLPDYVALEAKVTKRIFDYFNVHLTETELNTVKMLDKLILVDEMKALFPSFYYKNWRDRLKLDVSISVEESVADMQRTESKFNEWGSMLLLGGI